jgi:hypothetical protein
MIAGTYRRRALRADIEPPGVVVEVDQQHGFAVKGSGRGGSLLGLDALQHHSGVR